MAWRCRLFLFSWFIIIEFILIHSATCHIFSQKILIFVAGTNFFIWYRGLSVRRSNLFLHLATRLIFRGSRPWNIVVTARFFNLSLRIDKVNIIISVCLFDRLLFRFCFCSFIPWLSLIIKDYSAWFFAISFFKLLITYSNRLFSSLPMKARRWVFLMEIWLSRMQKGTLRFKSAASACFWCMWLDI